MPCSCTLFGCNVTSASELNQAPGEVGERLRAERAVPQSHRFALASATQVPVTLFAGSFVLRWSTHKASCRSRRLRQTTSRDHMEGWGSRQRKQRWCSRDNSERVAIRRRSRQSLYAKTAAGAGLVLHYEPMTQPVSEFLTHNASEDRCRSLRRVKSRRGSQRSCHGKSPPGRRPLRTPQSKKPAMLQQWPMRLICSCSRPHPAQKTEKLPPPHARSLDLGGSIVTAQISVLIGAETGSQPSLPRGHYCQR